MSTYPPKISLYSLSDLKNTLDDHIPIYLTGSPAHQSSTPLPKPSRFVQSNTHTIIRLSLGYSAVIIAAILFYQDYVLKLEWRDTKDTTLYACVAYFVLNGALTAWLWFGEKGVVFVGSRRDASSKQSTSLRIHSLPGKSKYDPTYRISATWVVGDGSREKGVAEVEAPFTKFFAQDGYFVPGEFEAWLKKELPVIAAGDAKKEIKSRGEDLAADADDEESEEVLVVDSATPSGKSGGSGSSASGSGSAKKRSKRKT